MPNHSSAPSSSSPPHNFADKIASEEQALYKQFPQWTNQLRDLIKKRVHVAEIAVAASPVLRRFSSTLSEEELLSILQKLREVSQLPGNSFDNETRLYLEQQLADVLGFEVSDQLENYQLSFTKATIASLSHLQHHPSDNHTQAKYLPEAGTASNRSYFGWESARFEPTQPVQIDAQQLFWIALPLHYYSKSFISKSDLKSWWKGKKVLVLNPTEAIAIVAEIKDDFYDTANKYQLGGSPAVIRDGMFWSPLNLGKSLLFFITDQSDQVPCGKYELYK